MSWADPSVSSGGATGRITGLGVDVGVGAGLGVTVGVGSGNGVGSGVGGTGGAVGTGVTRDARVRAIASSMRFCMATSGSGVGVGSGIGVGVGASPSVSITVGPEGSTGPDEHAMLRAVTRTNKTMPIAFMMFTPIYLFASRIAVQQP